jgi:diaminopropionate ammonia-lyase
MGLAGLCNDTNIRKKIDLDNSSNILLFGCEGDADEELYQKLLSE